MLAWLASVSSLLHRKYYWRTKTGIALALLISNNPLCDLLINKTSLAYVASIRCRDASSLILPRTQHKVVLLVVLTMFAVGF